VDRFLPLWSDRILAIADRHRHKLFLALIPFYLLSFNGQWRLEPDSALYLTIGRNVAEGHGYTYLGMPHRLAFPGLPLLFAGIFRLFHTEHLLPALIVMMLIGAATLALTYRLFLLYSDRPTAVLITFGLGISRLFYRYNFELLSDMPFLMGAMAFLVGYEAIFHRRQPTSGKGQSTSHAKWYDWALLVSGLGVAIAMRPSMWALLIAIVLAMSWSIVRGPVRWPQIITCATVLTGAVLFWVFDPRHNAGSSMGQYEDALFRITLTHWKVLLHNLVFRNIPKLFEGSLSQTMFGARLGPGLSTLGGIGIIVVCATQLRDRPLWFLWVAITFLMMLLVIEPLDRYFLEALPLMVFAWWSGIRWLNYRLPQPWADRVFIALFVLGGTVNLLRCGEFIVDQRRFPFRDYYLEGRYASIDRVSALVHNHVEPKAWVMTSPIPARIITFYSRRNVIGPKAEIDLDRAGVPLYILDPSDDDVLDRFKAIRMKPGPQLGPSVQSKYDPQPWMLHRAESQ